MTTTSEFEPLTGHCTCKTITYTLSAHPLFTHCCHCTWCQRETGTAFVLNAMIESYNFRITSPTKPTINEIPTPSGDGQLVARCPTCLIPVYAHYGGDQGIFFIKVGTLVDGSRERVKPDIHIYTSTKAEWVNLEKEKERVPIFEEYYKSKDVWPKESLERRDKFRQWEAEQKKAKDEAK